MKKTIAKLRAFARGFIEFRNNCGLTWDDNPDHPLSVAYDHGREWAHRLTLRRFEG